MILLSAYWTNLLVLNFETEKKFLEQYVPSGTELNDWNRKYIISLVGFQFSKTKFLGIPSPFYQKFPEINLRFYVKRKTKDGWRKGVVFIKEIAPAKLIGFMAGWLYQENFIALQMKHSLSLSENEKEIEYKWKINNEWNYIKALVKNESLYYPDESLENFISSHYWGYTKLSEQKTKEFEVIHQPWHIQTVNSFDIRLDAETIYGKKAAAYLSAPPYSAFLMDGSETKVTAPVLIKLNQNEPTNYL